MPPPQERQEAVSDIAAGRPDGAPFLAWPGAAHLRLAAGSGIALTVFFYLCYGGASWLTSQHAFRVRVDFDFEHRIPLMPGFAIVYLSIVPLLLLAPFVLRDRDSYLGFVRLIAVQTVVGSVCFIVLPVKDNFAAGRAAAGFGEVYTTADLLNLEGNMLPSLHVAIAITCAIVFGKRQRAGVRAFLWSWAMLIAASTLLTHQHHLLDLPAGALLAVLAARLDPGGPGRPQAKQCQRSKPD